MAASAFGGPLHGQSEPVARSASEAMRPYLDFTDPNDRDRRQGQRRRSLLCNVAGSSICRTHQLSSILYRAVNGYQEGGTPTLPAACKRVTSAIERVTETVPMTFEKGMKATERGAETRRKSVDHVRDVDVVRGPPWTVAHLESFVLGCRRCGCPRGIDRC